MDDNFYSQSFDYNWTYENIPNQSLPTYRNDRCETSAMNSHARTMAQERRRMENSEFHRLSSLLPLPRAISEKHLDKATIVRIASTYIRLNHAVSQWKSNRTFGGPLIESNVVNMLDGFLLCVSTSGTILYVSETISTQLGLSQVELCGSVFWDYIHGADLPFARARLDEFFRNDEQTEMILNLRFKSTLTKRRNRETPYCAAGYKISLFCQLIREQSFQVISMEFNNKVGGSFFAFCQPHSARISNGMRVQNSLVLSLDDALAIIYADNQNFFWPKIQIGASFYSYVHPNDLVHCVDLHNQLRILGSHRTPFIRLTIQNHIFETEIVAIRYNNPVKKPFGLNGIQSSRITLLITIFG
ncbi:Helix-loop-helix 34 [Aphelenchoides besseyi]|nr:Helix-loop-helix 34 [Aphelenchoides besseyi]